jgi:pimeloyl-ACP methyl ester carboxylesterase
MGAQDKMSKTLRRPDGVELHWEAQGEGPLVAIVHHLLWSHPDVYRDLVADLVRDHRVVQYDPRGCGHSSRAGPYELETDAEDLLVVLEAAGRAATVVAIGYAFNIAVRAAARRPDVISHVIAIGPAAAAMLPRSDLKGTDALAASDSVIEMMLTMLTTDPRAALRTLIGASNPGIDEDVLRDRVDRVAAYISQESALGRARAWLDDNVTEQGQRLGGRLWIQFGRTEPFYGDALNARVAERFPEAHLEQFDEGPVSRPDLAAAVVRRASGRATV